MSKDKSELQQQLAPTFSRREVVDLLPSHKLSEEGMPARTALQLCKDELLLNGRPRLNLASFVTTFMEQEAEELIQQTLNINLVDHDEYPQAVKIERRCVAILADLFNAQNSSNNQTADNPNNKDSNAATGTSTIGSSEAVMLAGLAMKWRWRQKQSADEHKRPKLIMGSNVQVVWEKFCRYFDVDPCYIEITAQQTTITAAQVAALCDESTIGVVSILGTTFTGEYEPIANIAEVLDDCEKNHGWDIPLHVDAASGGMVAPFVQPDLVWDFKLPRVRSINVSGHKYGLVYPGVGWVIWSDAEQLPKELIFDVNYLGGDMPTFNLNFSRPSAFVIAQYYNFLRLGFSGYRGIISNLMALTERLSSGLQSFGCFELLSKPNSLPVVTVRLLDDSVFSVFDLSYALRNYGWIVPAYTLPKAAQEVAVLRFVIREDMSADLIDELLVHCQRSVQQFIAGDLKVPASGGKSKDHVC